MWYLGDCKTYELTELQLHQSNVKTFLRDFYRDRDNAAAAVKLTHPACISCLNKVGWSMSLVFSFGTTLRSKNEQGKPSF